MSQIAPTEKEEYENGIWLKENREFLPFVKLDGKNGIASRSIFDGNERRMEVMDDFTAIVDFNTVQIGWMRFAGETPDMRLVAMGDPLPDCPGEGYKQGVKMVVMPAKCGPHEMATTANGVYGALGQLYDRAKVMSEWQAGQVPIVKISGWSQEKTKKGTRAVPVFAIVGWKPRPEVLKKYKVEPQSRAAIVVEAKADKPPITGSAPIEPPQSKSAPEPPAINPDDFG